MSESSSGPHYYGYPHGLPDNPDVLIEEYVDLEQRTTDRAAELARDSESFAILVRLALEQLEMGMAPIDELINAINELLENITTNGSVTVSDLKALLEYRPDVDRAVPLSSGEVHAGWQGRL